MILGVIVASLITASVGLAVWSSTGDGWATGQATAGTFACMMALGLVLDILSRFGDTATQRHDEAVGAKAPSPAWLVPGLAVGDGSERHLRTRTFPALRELACELLRLEHGLDLDDPADSDHIRSLLGTEAYSLLEPGGAQRLGRDSRAAKARIETIVEGLQRA